MSNERASLPVGTFDRTLEISTINTICIHYVIGIIQPVLMTINMFKITKTTKHYVHVIITSYVTIHIHNDLAYLFHFQETLADKFDQ